MSLESRLTAVVVIKTLILYDASSGAESHESWLGLQILPCVFISQISYQSAAEHLCCW